MQFAPAKSNAILAARAIVRGDADSARRILAGRRALSVAEARAVAGACAESNRRYGSKLNWTSFIA